MFCNKKTKHTRKILSPFPCDLLIAIVLVHLLTYPAECLEQQVVVSLFKAHQPLHSIYLAGPARITRPIQETLAAGLYKLTFENDQFKLSPLKGSGKHPIYIRSNEFQLSSPQSALSLGTTPDTMRRYRGMIAVMVRQGEILCYNTVSMRDYVCSVVGSESNVDFPEEALKAQSVLIQTAMARYKKYDELNDSTEKQAYLGCDYERTAAREALRKTWGETLQFQGRPVPVYFHSCCAGATSSSELFTGKAPVLSFDKSVACSYCKKAPFWKTTTQIIPANIFAARFPEGLARTSSKDKAGRPLIVSYDKTGATETGYACWLKIGQRLGWDKMPGTRFEISRKQNGDIELKSTGGGHGVGLCQWGAAGMAKSGIGYEKILKYYFPGAGLSKKSR